MYNGEPYFLTDAGTEPRRKIATWSGRVMATVRMKKMGPRGLTRKEGGDWVREGGDNGGDEEDEDSQRMVRAAEEEDDTVTAEVGRQGMELEARERRRR